MEASIIESLAKSEDEEFRAIAFRRLLRKKDLNEEEKGLLREQIPRLSYYDLLDLIAAHGTLGCGAQVVDRLVAHLPKDPDDLALYFFLGGRIDLFVRSLDPDEFADLVERVRPLVPDRILGMLLAKVQGCPLFASIRDRDEERPDWAQQVAPKPLAADLFELRRDERGCRHRLEARVVEVNRAELLRLHWVLERAGLQTLAAAAWARILDLFRFRAPVTREEEVPPDWFAESQHWLLVRDWVMSPAPDKAARLSWLADRVAELERGGYTFGGLAGGDAVPEELRMQVAGVLIDRDQAPAWAGPVLEKRLATRSLEAWNAVFRWWERWSLRRHGFLGGYNVRKAILLRAPLPEDAPPEFDEAFLRCAHEVAEFELEQIGHRQEMVARSAAIHEAKMPPLSVEDDAEDEMFLRPHLRGWCEQYYPRLTRRVAIERLLEMPLQRERAARFARLLKERPRLFYHPRIAEIAAAAGPLAEDELPAFDTIHLDYRGHVAIYRSLRGPAADELLRRHVRAALREAEGQEGKEGEAEYLPFSWWGWVEDVADDSLRQELRAWVRAGSLPRTIVAWRSAPWLVDDPMLQEVANRYLDEGGPWGFHDLPPILLPFVERRARRTDNDRELLHLLAWLDAQGVVRATRIGILIDRLERRPPSAELVSAPIMLETRSAWEKEGPRFIRAFARTDQWAMLGRLWWAIFSTSVRGTRPGGGGTSAPLDPYSFIEAIHLAFATVLLDLAAEAVDAGDEARLVTLLTALLQLDPPPPIVRVLRKLAKRPSLSARARERIEMGTTLFKSPDGRVATFDALFDAVRTLSSMTATQALDSAHGPASS